MKRKKTLIIYFVLLALALVVSAVSFQISRNTNQYQHYDIRDFNKIKESKHLNIITNYNNMYNGGVEDIRKKTKHLCDSLQIELRILFEDNYKKALTQLIRGNADILAFYTPKISNTDTTEIMFIQNKIVDPIFLVQRADSSKMITSQKELAHKIITLPLGSEYKIFVDNLSDYLGQSINIQYDSLYNYEQLAIKVGLGKIDYTLCNSNLKKRLSGKIDNINMDIPISFDLMGGWIIRRNCKELEKLIN